jgi:hypothetical protein
MGWMIRVEGAEFREEQVTGAHVALVNGYLGRNDWSAVDPMSSPETLMMWAAVAVSEMTKQSIDDTLLFVQMLPLTQLLSCFVADAPPPVAEEPAVAPETGTQGPLVAPWPVNT